MILVFGNLVKPFNRASREKWCRCFIMQWRYLFKSKERILFVDAALAIKKETLLNNRMPPKLKSKTISLDVGCGDDKKGDIGVDIRREKSVDVIADCYNLPFRDNVFDEVLSTTLLEHCLNPFQALKEQVRVLKKGGNLKCETDSARYWRFNVNLKPFSQYHPTHFRSKDGSYDASDTHYMIFYPENVERMFKLLELKNVAWAWRKNPWKKLDRLFRLLHFFEGNMYPRFIVVGRK